MLTLPALLSLLLTNSQPRTHLVPEWERVNTPPSNPFKLVRHLLSISDDELIQRCGLDAYCFLRYLAMLFKIFCILMIFLLPVLLPVNLIGGKGTQLENGGAGGPRWNVTGLDQLAWGNIQPQNSERYWVHLVLAAFTIICICSVFLRELQDYIRVRHAYLVDPKTAIRTILVTNIPNAWLPQETQPPNKGRCRAISHLVEKLYFVYETFPGGVQEIWLNRQSMGDMLLAIHRRSWLQDKLEAAVTNLIIRCNQAYEKGLSRIQGPAPNVCHTDKRYREQMRRPMWDTKWRLYRLWETVDTIRYCCEKIQRLTQEIEKQKRNVYPARSAFIEFIEPLSAHLACQVACHHQAGRLQAQLVIGPEDVIWANVSLTGWQVYLRRILCVAVMMAITVAGAPLVAGTGILSQLSYLRKAFPSLTWIDKLPDWFISAAQGLLPSLCLALLMMLLPALLRWLCRQQGLHTRVAVELMMQQYYFAFLFIQLFLVVAVSCSFSTIYRSATEITSWPTLLAENVPKASNYFLSFLILQAMSISAGELAQIARLLRSVVLRALPESTARQKWNRMHQLPELEWGTFFPLYTTLACIGNRPQVSKANDY